MIAKLGPLVRQVAGSIGGTTFQRGPDGLIIRSKPIPKPAPSPAKVSARQRAKSLMEQWRLLDPADRADWDTFAGTVSWVNRFGDPVTGTGYRAFLRCNMASYASAAGIDQKVVQTTYPLLTSSALPGLPEFSYDLGSDLLYLNSPDGKVASDTKLAVFASAPTTAGRSTWHGSWRYLITLAPEKSLPSGLTPKYTAAFGRIPSKTEREMAFLRLVAYNSDYNWPGLATIVPMVYL